MQRKVLLRSIRQTSRVSSSAPVRSFIQRSAPYAVNSLFNYAYNRGDILFVSAFAGVLASANYAPASQLQNLLALMPALLSGGIVPVTSTAARGGADVEKLRRVTFRIAQIGVIFGLPLAVVLTLAIPVVTPAILGNEFGGAIVPAIIVCWSLPFLAVHTPLGQGMIARGLARQTTVAYSVAFGVSALLHVFLDSEFAASGAALSSAARDPVALVALYLLYRRYERRNRTVDEDGCCGV
jgi:O-antigen/teichoic acid export membrane protein